MHWICYKSNAFSSAKCQKFNWIICLVNQDIYFVFIIIIITNMVYVCNDCSPMVMPIRDVAGHSLASEEQIDINR